MICVEDVKIFQVDRDTFERVTWGDWQVKPENKVVKKAGKTEVIRGRVFNNARGEEICLAMTREVQITLGLPFEVFGNMERELSTLRQEERRSAALTVLANLKVSMYEGAGFFKRLKYAFIGQMKEK